jgi:hypothetical protein
MEKKDHHSYLQVMKTNIFKHRHAGTELESRYNSAVHKTHHHKNTIANFRTVVPHLR